MGHFQPWFPKSDAIQRCQKLKLDFHWKITAAKTISVQANAGGSVIYDFDAAGNLTQTLIDAFLTDSEAAGGIAAASYFDSTSMGSNMFGFVVDMKGGVKSVSHMLVRVVTTAGGTPAVSAVLVNTAPVATTAAAGIAVSTGGNLYGRLTDGNLDAGTAGFIEVEIFFDAK